MYPWLGAGGAIAAGFYKGDDRLISNGLRFGASSLVFPVMLGAADLGKQAIGGISKGVRYAMYPPPTVPIPGFTGCHWVPLRYSNEYF